MRVTEPRIDVLRRRLAARTDSDGKPLPGFAENVAAIKAEITRMEGNRA
jgi:hypothetical protein